MLNKKQIDQYNEDGFTIFPNFLKSTQIQRFIEVIETITRGNSLDKHDTSKMEMEPDQEKTGNKVRRLYEPCSYYPIYRDYAESQEMLECVELLLGSNIICHYSKLNMKPSKIGSVVEWHQDLAYYPLTNRDSIAVLLYLDDTTIENGCLKVLPKMHKGTLLNHTEDHLFQGRITEEINFSGALDIEGKAGTAIFLNCMTPHASNSNKSNQTRRTLIVSYRAADAYPIMVRGMGEEQEKFSRLVRGEELEMARFTMDEFPIPKYKGKLASLYQLQERSKNKTL